MSQDLEAREAGLGSVKGGVCSQPQPRLWDQPETQERVKPSSSPPVAQR